MKPPLIFGTLLEHGAEVPNNEGSLFSIEDFGLYEKDRYRITVKASRKALLDLNGRMMYSVAQIFDKDGKEAWHEVYPSQLRESQAEKIIDQIKFNLEAYLKS